ncbi:MAG: hypothetical protein C0473_02265 [Cyanobacteria bacterium DS3.002]|nr:hypothetical protein [Cyanobacteria bacterium DS3.002]MBA4049637.1 hypothetical protein [Cyanobacteria bacterium DS2.008]MBA4073398.1 hypothetical protein [Cyanobacteria bacterium PR.023]
MEENKTTTKKSKKLSILVSILVSVLLTAGSFWLFGGEHYLANKADIDYRFFHHQEDDFNPVNWIAFLLETGQLAGFLVFITSALTIILYNRQYRS